MQNIERYTLATTIPLVLNTLDTMETNYETKPELLAIQRYSAHPDDSHIYLVLVELSPRKWVCWTFNASSPGFSIGDYFSLDHPTAGRDPLECAWQAFHDRLRSQPGGDIRAQAYGEGNAPWPSLPTIAGSLPRVSYTTNHARLHYDDPDKNIDVMIPANGDGWQLYGGFVDDDGKYASRDEVARSLATSLARVVYAYSHDLRTAEQCREYMSSVLDKHAVFGAADSEGFITAATVLERAVGSTLGLR